MASNKNNMKSYQLSQGGGPLVPNKIDFIVRSKNRWRIDGKLSPSFPFGDDPKAFIGIIKASCSVRKNNYFRYPYL